MKRVVIRDSHIVGTYDDATLLALLNAGTLRLGDHYWDEKTATWRPLTDFIGARAPARRLGAIMARAAALLLAAACGSAATWWRLRGTGEVPVTGGASVGVQAATGTDADGAPRTESPAAIAGIENKTLPVAKTTVAIPTQATPPSNDKPKPAQSGLAILNVEVFEGEAAVTVQNNGTETVDGFDLRLKYFALPAEKLEFDRNEAAISAHDAGTAERADKTKVLDAIVAALNRNLNIVRADVITWTPDHIKALPTAEQWKAFGDMKLGEAGAALAATAASFSSGASSTVPAVREKALTQVLPELGRRSMEIRPLLEAAIAQAGTTKGKVLAEQNAAEARLAGLKQAQRAVEPRLEALLAEARKTTLRSEVVHVDAPLEAGLVQRVLVKHAKQAGEGVLVDLRDAGGRSVALSPAGQSAAPASP
ncbi:MAG: hypothetical protein K1X78_23735 [Verrucomicrobiaceae bacterium]|nr:hypothetical protein [Verrucomicrobiaceae bacterium]